MSRPYSERYFSAFTSKKLGDDAVLRDIVVLADCDCDLSERCRILYRGRNTLWESNDGRFCVKFYRVPGRIKGLIYRWLRMPKARRAWENAHRLIELGFDTPAPEGVMLMQRGHRLDKSCYICRMYREPWAHLRGIESRPDFPGIVTALAAYMLRLHRVGVWMKDFTPGNVLFRPAAGGGYDFALVDINRMCFGVTSQRKLLSNFGSPLDTADAVDALAREYAALAGDPSLHDRAMKIYRSHRRFLARKAALKKFFRRR